MFRLTRYLRQIYSKAKRFSMLNLLECEYKKIHFTLITLYRRSKTRPQSIGVFA